MYARIISLLRRYKKNHIHEEPTYRLMLDKVKEVITLDSELLDLTLAEYTVLKLLITHRGSTVSKEQILYDSEVFQFGSDGSLAVILNRLRNKLGDAAEIKTVRGVGYRLVS
jgi:DNA-binding response OmpR family regulator